MAVNTPTTGAIVRDNNGRFAPGTKGIGQPITADNSREMLARRREKKQEAIQRAANQAVQSSTMRGEFGGEAWIAEIASVQMMIATTPDAGQAATKAADWLITNAGLGERQRDDVGGVSAVVHTIDPQVVALLAQIAEQQQGAQYSGVIEAEASDIQDTDTGVGGGDTGRVDG